MSVHKKLGLALSLLVVGVVYTVGSAKGVVIVDGYAHAVAMCDYKDSTHSEDMVTQGDEYHMWVQGGVTYVVNYGHRNDPQIARLETLAIAYCSQYQQ